MGETEICVLDSTDGNCYLYKMKHVRVPTTARIEAFVDKKGHSLTNCQWQVVGLVVDMRDE